MSLPATATDLAAPEVAGAQNLAVDPDWAHLADLGPRNDQHRIRLVQSIANLPWILKDETESGMAPVLLEGAPSPQGVVSGIGIATAAGLIPDVPLETLGMIAREILFARALGIPQVYVLMATNIGFESGGLGLTDANREHAGRLEKILANMMAAVRAEATFGDAHAPNITTVWDGRPDKDPLSLYNHESFRRFHDAATASINWKAYPDDSNFPTYLCNQKGLIQAFLEGFEHDSYGLLQASVKFGWHAKNRDKSDGEGTELVFDQHCQLKKLACAYTHGRCCVAPRKPKIFSPPYAPHPEDKYIISLRQGEGEKLADLLAGCDLAPLAIRSNKSLSELWRAEYCRWTQSLLDVIDSIVEAFPQVRIDFSNLSVDRNKYVGRKTLAEAQDKWNSAFAASEKEPLDQRLARKAHQALDDFESVKARFLIPRILAIVDRFGTNPTTLSFKD